MSFMDLTVLDGIKVARSMGSVVPLSELDFVFTIIKCVGHIEVLQTVRDVCLSSLVDNGQRRSSGSPSPGKSVTSTSPITPSSLENSPSRVYPIIKFIPPEQRKRILNCIYESYAVARAFNSNHELRTSIWKKGLVQQMPNLVKQETISLAAHIRILFFFFQKCKFLFYDKVRNLIDL